MTTPPLDGISERDFTNLVIDYAQLRGWTVAHFRPAQTRKGWRTPMQGQVGFPDLTLARSGLVIFAELKTEKGRLTDDQRHWLTQLDPDWQHPPFPFRHPTGQLWRPSDWDIIQRVLA